MHHPRIVVFSRASRGITLLEVLVTTSIIAIIAALGLPAVRVARARAAVIAVQSAIANLEASLSMYQTDIGDYPFGNGNGCCHLVACLVGPCNDPAWKGPYMRFKEADLDTNGNFLDIWKSPFSYWYPQTMKPTVPFVIISAGPDKRFGTGDDIGNW